VRETITPVMKPVRNPRCTRTDKTPKLGTGVRFRHCVENVMARARQQGKEMTEERAAAICAAAGRKKYGASQMAKWAAASRKQKDVEKKKLAR